jgi:hypothetical protein
MDNHSVENYHIKYGLFYDSSCLIYCELMDGGVLELHANFLLKYILKHDPALKQYFSSMHLVEEREQLMELKELGYPFLERLQEYVPCFKRRLPVVFKMFLIYPCPED